MSWFWIFIIATSFIFFPNFIYLLYRAREHRTVIIQENNKWIFKKEYIHPNLRNLCLFTIVIFPIAFMSTIPVAISYFLFLFGKDIYTYIKRKISKKKTYKKDFFIFDPEREVNSNELFIRNLRNSGLGPN